MKRRRRNPVFDMTQTGEFLQRSFDEDPRLGTILHVASKLSAPITQRELLELIMDSVTNLLDAERSTLFLLAEDGEHLWSEVAQGEERIEIEIKIGEGLAGWVAQTGRGANVKDAYADPRFDARWDLESGFKTRSVLSQPLRDREGRVIGVAQAMNKRDGSYFSLDDEILLRTVMALAAISVVNGDLYRSLLTRNFELREAKIELQERVRAIDLLYAVEREVAQQDDVQSAVDRLLHVLCEALACGSAGILLITEGGALVRHELEAGEPLMRTAPALEPGVMTSRALNNSGPVLLSDLSTDQVASSSQLSGACNGAAVCLRAQDTKLGALYLIDWGVGHSSAAQPELDEDDIKLLDLVATQAARVIARLRAKEKSEREMRLASLGGAMAGILHDFRTPMTIASGYVQMLAGSDDPARRAELASAVMKQLERVTAMSRDVLGFARGSAALFVQRVHVNDFIKECEELIGQIFSETDVHTSVECHYKGAAKFDRIKAIRVVQNMARNARDAMLAVAKGDGVSQFTMRVSSDNDRLVMTFVDNGPGVSTTFRHRMFDAFATEGKKDGSGLGLAMVAQFAETHGGVVTYADTPGGGATFTVNIALYTDTPSG